MIPDEDADINYLVKSYENDNFRSKVNHKVMNSNNSQSSMSKYQYTPSFRQENSLSPNVRREIIEDEIDLNRSDMDGSDLNK